MTPQARGQRTRERVLSAALPLLATRGVQTRVEDIRDASGVSVGSIYHHFGSRNAIVVAIYADALAALLDSVASAVCECENLNDGLSAFVNSYLTWLDEHREQARIIFSIRQYGVDSDAIEQSDAAKASDLGRIAGWYSGRVAAGEARRMDARVLEVLLVGPLAEYWQRKDSGAFADGEDFRVRELLVDAACRLVVAHS